MKYQSLLQKMSLQQKAALLSGYDVWTTKALPQLGIPALNLADGPSGLRKQAGESDHLGLNPSQPATCLPAPATIANSWNPQLAALAGELAGKEACAQNVQVLLGPGLNIKRSPLCGRNFEYYSEDPYLSGKMAAAFVQGVQSTGVAACPKHFAANSQETRRMANDSIVDERTLRELYLSAFEMVVREAAPQTIMTAYNKINGVYANEHPALLTGILREEWGFKGSVISDWGGGNCVVEGVKAGCNLEMPGTGGDSDKQLVQAVQSGLLSEEIVNQRMDELLTLVFSTPQKHEPQAFTTEQHHQIAADIAAESIVLLKNNQQALPLTPGQQIAVIGDFAQTPRYQGAGSSLVNPTKVDNLLGALQGSGLDIKGFAKGFQRSGAADEVLAHEAAELAKAVQAVVLCLGIPENYEVEGQDRPNMRLPAVQQQLLETIATVNQNIIVVLCGGSAVEMPWLQHCKALVHGYLGGQAGAQAMAKVLIGEVNPSGKLAESYPLHYEDTPAAAWYPGAQCTSEYREGLYVGYRYYETVQQPVLFPFGYGLSYTSFSYDDIQVANKMVHFTIKNTGTCAGAEVAQLYISRKSDAIFRALKELRGFVKVYLHPGESKRVAIQLNETSLRIFNAEKHQWAVEGGVYNILVGASVADIRLQTKIEVAGQGVMPACRKAELPAYYTGQIKTVEASQFAALLGKPLPPANWQTDKPLTLNDTVSQLFYAKSRLARMAWRILTHFKTKAEKAAAPNLNMLFIYYIPFRGMAKMMNGAFTMEMAEALLQLVNGHFLLGCKGLIGGYGRARKALKEYKKTWGSH